MSERGKGARNPNENPGVKPVKKIELSENKLVLRIVFAVVFLVIGLVCIGFSLRNCLSQSKGWTEITPAATTVDSVASELSFLYDLGAADASATVEYKELTRIYTELCVEAYHLYDASAEVEDVRNLHYLNRHVGEEVKVPTALYHAFEIIDEADSRLLYAAPYYTEWGNVFVAREDVFAEQYDPYHNESVASSIASISEFVTSDEHIRLELLGNDTVKLVVSETYRAFAKEHAIENFIDLYWARNAFAVDYVADALIEAGYHYGAVSSYDGFVRALDTRETAFTYNIYTRHEGEIYRSHLNYTGKNSIVFLHAYRLIDTDLNYYQYQNGELRHPYVDVEDGFCKNAADELLLFSDAHSCAEVLMAAMPVYISDVLRESAIAELKSAGIYTVYAEGTTLYLNAPDAEISNLYHDDTIVFTSEKR